MRQKFEISRRTFLKGSGVAIALPVLESMLPAIARAEAVGAAPKRLIYIYAPIGINMPGWNPPGTSLATLGSTMQSLAPYTSHLLVISGSDNQPSAPNPGPGDHGSGAGGYLTGVQVAKSSTNVRAAISVDQIIANQIGSQTKLPSLTISCDASGNSDDCDSGYSCAYTNNISWISSTTPNAKDTSPVSIFNRLFGTGTAGQTANQVAKRNFYKKSILDYALESATTLRAKLGKSDQAKLDEHMAAVRDIETRMAASIPPANACAPGTAPTGTPSDYQTYMRLMYDLLAMAFKCDLTRVATFMLTDEPGGHSYPFLNVPENHHTLSHVDDGSADNKLRIIDKWRVDQLAYFIGNLKNTVEGAGSLLDNMMVVYGASLQYVSHSHNNLPLAIIGKGGGTITTNRILNANVPLANIHLALMNRMGVNATKFGDSTGVQAL